MKPLNAKTAHKPLYTERIVQFGAGNFLRAFANWMVDILNDEAAFDSSVVVVKATPKGSYATLDNQDGLYHTRLYSINEGKLQTQTRLINSISRTINPYHDNDVYLELAKQRELRFIISNTTESGIRFEERDNFSDKPANSFPAKLTQFLYERFTHFDGVQDNGAQDKGMIILPCELIEDNGSELKKIVLRYAQLWNLEDAFGNWIENSNTFCNTLVDRIVTGFPKENIETIWQELGFKDEQLVEGEAYHSWIIEDLSNLKESLPIAKTNLNLQFTSDLSIQREIKVRILNGAHTAMVPTGYLYGLRTVDAVVTDDQLATFIEQLLYNEVIPTLTSSTEELEQFAKSTLLRFQNPTLQHHLSAIALNSTSKFATRLLPSLVKYYELYSDLPKRIVFAFACLIRFYKGEWQTDATPVQDASEVIEWWNEVWSEVASGSTSTHKLVDKVLANSSFWGQDLQQLNGFKELLTSYLEALEEDDMTIILKTIENG